MKDIFLLIVLISFTQVQSQNELTAQQFDNIEIHGVLKTTIENTNGGIQAMYNIFGSGTIEEDGGDIGEKCRKFSYSNGLCIIFSGFSQNQTPFLVKIQANSIKIYGNVAYIGDNINVLGSNIQITQNSDGSKSAIFTKLDSDCCPLILYLNPVTNVITGIEYMVLT